MAKLIRPGWALLITLVWVTEGSVAREPVPAVDRRCVVLITLDGLRGEEVFGGADLRLIHKENGVEQPDACMADFWRDERTARREALLPFLWQQCRGEHGWIAGDTELDSVVTVTNGKYFSYPGYNEILSGFADPKIDSNDKKYNPNKTVLEWLHEKPAFSGRVAAYCSWDVFPYILNDQRSQIPVNAGWVPLTIGDPARNDALNLVASQLFHQWPGVRYDAFTASGALEEIRARQPRILYVALGETDDWAHGGRYDRYLLTARQNDALIRELWQATQQLPGYRENTLFLITTDHGRGDGREGWKNHSRDLPGSERIWVAAFGPGLARQGIDHGGRFQQAQVASTVAAYLGHDFTQSQPSVAPPLPIVLPLAGPQ